MGKRALSVLPLFFAVLAAGPTLARAQAWTPDKNTLVLDGSYQLGYSTRTEDIAVTVIHQYFIPEVDYGITDKLAVSLSLPVLAVKTDASAMHAHGPWDDGSYHSTLTDLRFTARYMIPVGFLAITPQVGLSSPVQSYPVQGYAAAGRDLKAAYAGINIGADLDDYIPRTFLHLAYEFALVERYENAGPTVAEFGQNYSSLSAEIGHHLGKFTLTAALDWRYYDGGISFADFNTINPTQLAYHDVVLLERILLVGGGINYAASKHVGVYASARIFVSGANTENASIFAAGASWDLGL